MTGARRYWTDVLCRRHWAWFDRVGPAEVALLSGPCARAAGLAAALLAPGFHTTGGGASLAETRQASLTPPLVAGTNPEIAAFAPQTWPSTTAGGGYPPTYPQAAIPEPPGALLLAVGAALAVWARRA